MIEISDADPARGGRRDRQGKAALREGDLGLKRAGDQPVGLSAGR
jgi:hypothetical protein